MLCAVVPGRGADAGRGLLVLIVPTFRDLCRDIRFWGVWHLTRYLGMASYGPLSELADLERCRRMTPTRGGLARA